MRLADAAARLRLLYPRPIPTMPDILVIDVPPVFAAPTLPSGRYYPDIIETDDERREWDAFITGERKRPVAPDLLDRRPSVLVCDDISFVHYVRQSPDGRGCSCVVGLRSMSRWFRPPQTSLHDRPIRSRSCRMKRRARPPSPRSSPR